MASLLSGGPRPTEKQIKHTLRNTKYSHYSVAAKHIVAVVDSYSDLKPSVKEYNYQNGKRMDLMQLNGTIPVTIMEQRYNIPIRIWLQRGYPKEKPIVFINPSLDMAISAVDYVDREGYVNVPYIQDWKEGKSDLITMVQVLRLKFSQQSPLYTISHHHSLPRMSGGARSERRSQAMVSHSNSFNSRHSMATACGHDTQMMQMRLDMEEQKKEIETLKERLKSAQAEIEERKKRVRELEEQIKSYQPQKLSVRNSFSSGVLDAMQREMTQEVEKEKKDKEEYKQRLDAMVTEITQVREDIGILKVEKEEYEQGLKVTTLQLKQALNTIAELQSVNSDLEEKLKQSGLQDHSEPDGDGDGGSLQRAVEKAAIAEKRLEEIETEKEELLSSFLAQVTQSQEVERQLTMEKEELLFKLETYGSNFEKQMEVMKKEKEEMEQKLAEALRGLKKSRSYEGSGPDDAETPHSQLVAEKKEFKSMLDDALRNIKTLELSESRLQSQLEQAVKKSEELETKMKEEVSKISEENTSLKTQLKKECTVDEVPATTLVSDKPIRERDTVSHDEIQLTQTMLGTGAWGYVVRGKFRGKAVAVKCLHKEILSCFSKAQVEREISIMAELRHPNLVLFITAVLDAPSGPMIITELLSCTLRHAYQQDLIPQSGKLDIMCDIALALNYLHLHHSPIIHRDISSSNILLEELAHGKWRAKLSDFGSANLVHQATTPGEGALVYSAPEMKTGAHKQQSPSADVYSYGVLLTEITTSTFPDHAGFSKLLDMVEAHWPQVSKVVTMCLVKEPSNRPTMLQIIGVLEAMVTMETEE